jgi:hypothetical protein
MLRWELEWPDHGPSPDIGEIEISHPPLVITYDECAFWCPPRAMDATDEASKKLRQGTTE